MTSRVVRMGRGAAYPGQLKEITISCDQMGCSKSVNDSEIRDGGGLKTMGWQVMPTPDALRHYCPDHNRS